MSSNKYDFSGQTLVVKAIETGADSGVQSGVTVGVAAPEANIADAVADHTVAAEFSNTEIKGFLDALGGKINAVIAVLEAHGLTEDS